MLIEHCDICRAEIDHPVNYKIKKRTNKIEPWEKVTLCKNCIAIIKKYKTAYEAEKKREANRSYCSNLTTGCAFRKNGICLLNDKCENQSYIDPKDLIEGVKE